MKSKSKKPIFICQITENSLKVIKCLMRNSKREFLGLEVETLPADIDDKKLSEELNRIFKKLEYKGNPVIVVLPRIQSTCRFLKIPGSIPGEIERIANLQAPRYLPYPSNELITGYQIISTDKEGYSNINLVIAHRDLIERYLNFFKELRPAKLTILLSSYGLGSLYSYINPQDTGSVMVIDIDSWQVELTILSNKKLLFSRAFKLNRAEPNWEGLFIDEIKKTQDAYVKEVSKEAADRIVLLGAGKILQEFKSVQEKQTTLSIHIQSYPDSVKLRDNLLNSILNSEYSFASLIGLGLEDIVESLNLLPQDKKEEMRKVSQRQKHLRLTLFVSGIILILGLGIAKDLDNKQKYLARLNIELNKITKQAKPLDEIEKRFQLLESRSHNKPTALEVIYELHRIAPDQIYLVNLGYEEDNQVVLRGQTKELNSVFEFVAQLEKSVVVKNFNAVKVRYATKKNTPTGEIVDFEIVCTKK